MVPALDRIKSPKRSKRLYAPPLILLQDGGNFGGNFAVSAEAVYDDSWNERRQRTISLFVTVRSGMVQTPAPEETQMVVVPKVSTPEEIP